MVAGVDGHGFARDVEPVGAFLVLALELVDGGHGVVELGAESVAFGDEVDDCAAEGLG